MSRSMFFLATLMGLILSAPPAAADECDDAGSLKGFYLSRCKTRLKVCYRYRGSARAPCISRTVQEAQRYQERKEGAKASAAATAGEWGVCNSQQYKDACSKVIQGRNDICGVAHSTPRISDASNAPVAKSVALWLGRYKGYVTLKQDIASFLQRYGKCNKAPRGYRPHCRFDDSEQRACAEAEAKFKQNWAAYIKDFEKQALLGQQRAIERIERARVAPTVTQNYDIDSPVRIIKGIQQINQQAAWLGYDRAQVDRLEKQLLANQQRFRKALERLLKKVKCPVSGRGGKFYGILVNHFNRTKKPGSTLKETIKRLKITGRAQRSYDRFRRISYETLPATACVLQQRAGEKTCRIFRMTFRRSKPAGAGWSRWGFYSIGGGGLMSCRNL